MIGAPAPRNVIVFGIGRELPLGIQRPRNDVALFAFVACSGVGPGNQDRR